MELQPQQFGDYSVEYAGHETSGGRMGMHRVVAKDGSGAEVGAMTWRTRSRKPGELDHIDVAKDHRRRGLATAMWTYASESGLKPTPVHSAQRTDDGDAWAKAVGGPRPRRLRG